MKVRLLRPLFFLSVAVLGTASASTSIDYADLMQQVLMARSHMPTHPEHIEPEQILELSATQLAEAIRTRKTSSEQSVVTFLERIYAVNPALNAVVTLDAKAALERAREADKALAAGQLWGPLHGVPFTIKDTYKTKALRTTAGYLPLANYTPEENAVVVQRLLDAGAILMGKTNTPSLAMDMQTSNAVFGTTVNRFNPTWTAGGSSGGAAVAVAARMTPFEFGTDLAGSIRLPAAFNGVYGFRPTFGGVSMRGHIPPRPNERNGIRRMATAGPIAHNLQDLSLLLDIVGGPGKGDHRLVPIPPAPVAQPTLHTLRIAWSDSFGGVPVDLEIKEALKAYAHRLAQAGASVTQTEPQDFPYEKAWETWGALVGAQGGYEQSNFMRSLGSFFTQNDVAATPMQRHIVGPISVPGYMDALSVQDQCMESLEGFLHDFDVWLVPVSSTTAFAHQQPTKTFGDFFVYGNPLLVNGIPVPYYVATQSYTTPFSLTESPVVTLPIGQDKKGAPIGIQMVGSRFTDHRLLKIAELLDEIPED